MREECSLIAPHVVLARRSMHVSAKKSPATIVGANAWISHTMYKQAKSDAMFPFSSRFSYRPASLCGGYMSRMLCISSIPLRFSSYSPPRLQEIYGTKPHGHSSDHRAFNDALGPSRTLFPRGPSSWERPRPEHYCRRVRKCHTEYIQLELLTICSIVSLQCMA